MENAAEMENVQSVVVTLNKQLYAFYIEEVVEILRVPTITTIPGISDLVEGVINLRGTIIPVLNLHKKFHLPATATHKKNRVVIVQGREENIGIMVDDVRMVTKFEENNVEPPSGQTLKEDMFLGFAKHEKQVIGVLNLEKVLYE